MNQNKWLMRVRLIIFLSLLYLLLASCSRQKPLYFPVLYKGWVNVPDSDTTYSTAYFQEDGRMRLSYIKEGDFEASWNLEVLKAKKVVFGFKTKEIKISVSPERGVSLELHPYYVDHPSEVSSWENFEFVLSETSEFFMLYDRPDEIEPHFYLEGIVKLNDNARSRRVKRLMTTYR